MFEAEHGVSEIKVGCFVGCLKLEWDVRWDVPISALLVPVGPGPLKWDVKTSVHTACFQIVPPGEQLGLGNLFKTYVVNLHRTSSVGGFSVLEAHTLPVAWEVRLCSFPPTSGTP